MRRKTKYTSAAQAQQDRELKKTWTALMLKYQPANAPSKRVLQLPDLLEEVRRREAKVARAPSVGAVDRVPQTRSSPRLNEEMQARERLAQVEIERKKLQVAPAFNKGGYQYISNPEDFKTMNRKV